MTCAGEREDVPDCVCPYGYYDEGVTACTICPASCVACTGYNKCTECNNSDERSGEQCECPEGYEDAEDGVACEVTVIVEEEDLIPVESYDDIPPVQVDIDPSTLSDDYEIGFGFYYKFLSRLPSRVEVGLPRENWLGIAGITETGDYGNSEHAGDRVLSCFQAPWDSNGM